MDARNLKLRLPCTSSDSFQERSEAEFRTMTNAVPAIIWAGNANGDNVYLNDRWYEYTGQTVAEAQGTGWVLALHPDDRVRIVSYWRRCCSTGDAYEGECRYRRHDGEYRWHEFRAAPFRNPAGHINSWYGVSIDITERKRIDHLFQDNWDQLRLAWQATGDILWDWDVKNGSLRLNYVENRLYQWMNMEGAPQSIQWLFNRIHPDDLPRIRRGILNAMADRSQTHWLDECRIVQPGGMKEMRVLFRGYVCRDATGKARRMVGSLQDLTYRRTQNAFY
jgi:PAS domain S-box-containing protein